MTETESHTIRLLQEMRAENAAFRKEVTQRFDSVDDKINKANDTVKRIDVRLRHVESTINKIAVTVGVDSRGIGILRTEVEELDRRISALEKV